MISMLATARRSAVSPSVAMHRRFTLAKNFRTLRIPDHRYFPVDAAPRLLPTSRRHYRIPSAPVANTVVKCHRLYFPAIVTASRTLCSSSDSSVYKGGKSCAGVAGEIEQMYERKTPIEHVLLRPAMYVGTTGRRSASSGEGGTYWTLESSRQIYRAALRLRRPDNDGAITGMEDLLTTVSACRMVRGDAKSGHHPALIKAFDEILVNAFDNMIRTSEGERMVDEREGAAVPRSMITSQIDVTLFPGNKKRREDPYISVRNNGRGIPVRIHKGENMYVPEMLFGHLLTGSNFDDKSKRLTGGRHGYGAKLTNIFSKSFEVETADSSSGLLFYQRWTDNMSHTEGPVVTKLTGDMKDFTRVSFIPDLARLTGGDLVGTGAAIDEGNFAQLTKRVIDAAGCRRGGASVSLNGSVLPLEGFQDYARLYLKGAAVEHAKKKGNQEQDDAHPMAFCRYAGGRWEVGIAASDSKTSFDSISFVNGVLTSRGGTHVDVLTRQIVRKIIALLEKKHPDLSITPSLVRQHLFVFCNTLVENPDFDSQMKEALTTPPSKYGTCCKIPDKFLNNFVRSDDLGIIASIVDKARNKQKSALFRKVDDRNSRLLHVAKLNDAKLAGTNRSNECTLILTEGDSAKSLAVAGLQVVGRETYGAFPLRGKLLNVRDASLKTLSKNEELMNLCAILGLDFKKTYGRDSSGKDGLRYARVMLMCDQDNDGSHIKGLLINFFHTYWPELLMRRDPPFLSSFVTPLIKASKGKATLSFFSKQEYDAWKNEPKEGGTGRWTIKYYKGLGTSTTAEAISYFKDFSHHHRPFVWNSDEDGELVEMAFTKSRADDRKRWILKNFDEQAALFPDSEGNIDYVSFMNKEFIHFSNANNVRSLPSVIDGLKTSQRKVLYACFRRKLSKEMKVAQLSGYIAEHTAYHHGEASLHATIVKMAQDYVGSGNNIGLLFPSGQFGTRLEGGEDAASPRYIFTHLTDAARILFPSIDDELLDYREDDGLKVEPLFYAPIIPLVLVNGAQGLGSGWSTLIPNHNPLDVIQYIRGKINGAQQSDLPKIRPYVHGFRGDISIEKQHYVTTGKIEKVSPSCVHISELPVGKWTTDYKKHLTKLRDMNVIRSFEENHTTSSVSFNVTMRPSELDRIKNDLETQFKLTTKFGITNMHCFDQDGKIIKYVTPEEIADVFFVTRLRLYHQRKDFLETRALYNATILENKARFITEKIDFIENKKSMEEMVQLLKDKQYTSASELERIKHGKAANETSGNECNKIPPNFDYLLNMPLSSFTSEKVHDLLENAKKLQHELDVVRLNSVENMWKEDLKKLERYLKSELNY